MNNISFRVITEDNDIRTIAELADQIWHEHYTGIISQQQIDYMVRLYQSPPAIKEQIRKEKYQYWMMTSLDNVPVGYMATQVCQDHIFLSKLYIVCTHRGLGYGSQAIKKIAEVAKENGFDKIRLGVNRDNTESLAVYEKWGFKKIDVIIKDIGGGFVMDDFILQKNL